MQAVEQFSLDAETKKNHQNCIKHIYNYWERSFPDYFRVGVRDLTEDKLEDTTKFYWKNTKDIVYKGLNSKFLKTFVATKTKKWQDVQLQAHSIYFDTVQWSTTIFLLSMLFY